MKAAPFWDALAATATCLAYDADMVADFSMPGCAVKSRSSTSKPPDWPNGGPNDQGQFGASGSNNGLIAG
jgi:hypothetical protein